MNFSGRFWREFFKTISIFMTIALGINILYLPVVIIQRVYRTLDKDSLLFKLISIFSSLEPYKVFDSIFWSLLVTMPLFLFALFFLEYVVTKKLKIPTLKFQKLVYALFLPTTLTLWLMMIFDETAFNFVVSIISFLALLYPRIEKS